jgi:hypothetical protein
MVTRAHAPRQVTPDAILITSVQAGSGEKEAEGSGGSPNPLGLCHRPAPSILS